MALVCEHCKYWPAGAIIEHNGTTMGICIQCLEMNNKDHSFHQTVGTDLNLANNWVWVVIRRDTQVNPVNGTNDWHIQGIAADENIAIEMCLDETYIIGPLPINSSLPHDKIEWIGSYFPYTQRKESDPDAIV